MVKILHRKDFPELPAKNRISSLVCSVLGHRVSELYKEQKCSRCELEYDYIYRNQLQETVKGKYSIIVNDETFKLEEEVFDVLKDLGEEVDELREEVMYLESRIPDFGNLNLN